MREDLPQNLARPPAQRALAGTGITSLDDLTKKTDSDVARLHGMGPKAIGQLKVALAAEGKSFAEEER